VGCLRHAHLSLLEGTVPLVRLLVFVFLYTTELEPTVVVGNVSLVESHFFPDKLGVVFSEFSEILSLGLFALLELIHLSFFIEVVVLV